MACIFCRRVVARRSNLLLLLLLNTSWPFEAATLRRTF